MEVAKLVLEFVRVLVWPVVVLVVAVMLRHRLRELLSRMTAAEAMGARAEFAVQTALGEEAAAEAVRAAARGEAALPADRPDPPPRLMRPVPDRRRPAAPEDGGVPPDLDAEPSDEADIPPDDFGFPPPDVGGDGEPGWWDGEGRRRVPADGGAPEPAPADGTDAPPAARPPGSWRPLASRPKRRPAPSVDPEPAGPGPGAPGPGPWRPEPWTPPQPDPNASDGAHDRRRPGATPPGGSGHPQQPGMPSLPPFRPAPPAAPAADVRPPVREPDPPRDGAGVVAAVEDRVRILAERHGLDPAPAATLTGLAADLTARLPEVRRAPLLRLASSLQERGRLITDLGLAPHLSTVRDYRHHARVLLDLLAEAPPPATDRR